jgi:hypothetical protein
MQGRLKVQGRGVGEVDGDIRPNDRVNQFPGWELRNPDQNRLGGSATVRAPDDGQNDVFAFTVLCRGRLEPCNGGYSTDLDGLGTPTRGHACHETLGICGKERSKGHCGCLSG